MSRVIDYCILDSSASEYPVTSVRANKPLYGCRDAPLVVNCIPCSPAVRIPCQQTFCFCFDSMFHLIPSLGPDVAVLEKFAVPRTSLVLVRSLFTT
jgi:hypothetical protein